MKVCRGKKACEERAFSFSYRSAKKERSCPVNARLFLQPTFTCWMSETITHTCAKLREDTACVHPLSKTWTTLLKYGYVDLITINHEKQEANSSKPGGPCESHLAKKYLFIYIYIYFFLKLQAVVPKLWQAWMKFDIRQSHLVVSSCRLDSARRKPWSVC